MISYKNKDGIRKISLFFNGFNEGLKCVISVCKCIELFLRFKSILFQLIFRYSPGFKIYIIFRGIKRPVIIGSLNNGKKRFLLLPHDLIGFHKQILITDSPHV